MTVRDGAHPDGGRRRLVLRGRRTGNGSTWCCRHVDRLSLSGARRQIMGDIETAAVGLRVVIASLSAAVSDLRANDLCSSTG